MTNVFQTCRPLARASCAIPFALALLAGACDARSMDLKSPTVPTRNRDHQVATLRIKPQGVYQVDGYAGQVPHAQLAQRLTEKYSRENRPRTLVVLAYKGVVGYDVVMALNAARQAGVSEVLATAEYVEGDEDRLFVTPKRWRQTLAPLDSRTPVARDTARRPVVQAP